MSDEPPARWTHPVIVYVLGFLLGLEASGACPWCSATTRWPGYVVAVGAGVIIWKRTRTGTR